MKKGLKRVILIKLAPVLAGILCIALIVSVAAATVSEIESIIHRDASYYNSLHEDDYTDDLDFFTISGSKNGNDYTLNFLFDGWSINGIKFSCADTKGNVSTTVKIPVAAASEMAEAIAETAEKYCWPKGTGTGKYDYDKGGTAYNGLLKIYKKWYPGKSTRSLACCCHTGKTILSETIGKKIRNTLLPNTTSAGTAKSKLEKAVNKYGFDVIAWDGKLSSLQRGDICSLRKKSGLGHVYIYLGNSLIADGSHSNKYFGRIRKFSTICKGIGNKRWYYIIRAKSGITGSTEKEKSAVLHFEYSVLNGTVYIQGSLDGTDIAGSFKASGNSISGSGEYGTGASYSDSIGNPYGGDKKFTITSIALKWRICPIHGKELHDGWDLATGGNGTAICAVTSGTVVHAGHYGGYGNHVVIIQAGSIYVLYGHMSSMTVQKGDSVTKGQKIGGQGNEGASAGYHLHLEFRKGTMNGSSTANLQAIEPMLRRYAINYQSVKDDFSDIVR